MENKIVYVCQYKTTMVSEGFVVVFESINDALKWYNDQKKSLKEYVLSGEMLEDRLENNDGINLSGEYTIDNGNYYETVLVKSTKLL